MKRIGIGILALLLLLAGCVQTVPAETADRPVHTETPADIQIEKETEHPDPDDRSPKSVAAYLRENGELPPYYLTKGEARDLGWVAEDGNLWEVTDKGVIGGDRFGNREGLLPDAQGRTWYEADVNYQGGHRGAERLVFSNDGLIFYTDDHYDSFTDWTKEAP